MKPPTPKKCLSTTVHFTYERHDLFAWMKDADDPDVIQYLEKENAFTQHQMKHSEELQKELLQEMRSRIPLVQTTAPYSINGWQRYARIKMGEDYWVYCRSKNGIEEILLDENERAREHQYYSLEDLSLNPNQEWLAWTEDTSGDERFILQVRSLRTNETHLIDHSNVKWTIAWLDNYRLVYVLGDEADRPCEIRIHDIRTPTSKESPIWIEPDKHFYITVERSRDGLGVLCRAESKSSSEVRILRPTSPAKLETVLSKSPNVKYDLSLTKDSKIIRSNVHRQNFSLYWLTAGTLVHFWTPQDDATIEMVDVFIDHIVCWMRTNGTQQIVVLNTMGQFSRRLTFPDPCFEIYPDINPKTDSEHFRLRYSALSCPDTVFEYCLNTGKRTTLKIFSIPNFDPNDWVCQRLWAKSKDGTNVPISLVQKKNSVQNQPMLLHGYGAYGVSYSTGFHESWLCLLDRGWTVGIAHVRGGGELGRDWYDGGKLRNKHSSFDDFIACCEHLININVTTTDSLIISGGSAGGLLMGTVLNQRPDLMAGCVAEVPFVDVTNTMLDPTLPLTIIEYEEWGNPNILDQYNTMMTYDPYQQYSDQQYPSLLVTAGLTDPRVGFWEPAKWIAKIRHSNTHSDSILLWTNLSAGHSGASGREEVFKEDAFKYAFILNCI